MSSQRFGKDRRVRRGGEYQRAFKAGIRVHGRFFTLVMASNNTASVRLGLVASRKLGNAVARNRAKRLIRELFRQNVTSESRAGVDVVVIPRREVLEGAYRDLEADFRGTFNRGLSRMQHAAR